MNATALATSVNGLIDKFGNSLVYHPPKIDATYYNTEGDWTPTYETTTISSTWVESNVVYGEEFAQQGRFHFKEGSMILKNNVGSLAIMGKCVSNSVDWEIVKIKPLRVKNVDILFEVEVKNILT